MAITVVPTNEQGVTPYSSVVEILVHFPGDFSSDGAPEYSIASGVIVGPNQILTAAHVFQNAEGQTPDQIEVLTQSGLPAGYQAILSNSSNVWVKLGDLQYYVPASGPLDYVHGDNPQLTGRTVANVASDIALLTVSADLLSPSNVRTYGLQALPIEPDANAGTYQMIGFDGSNTTTLLSDTEEATITTHNGSFWTGPFQAVPGMSGGPLLSPDNAIVGVQSDENVTGTAAQANRINTGEYNQIQNWMDAFAPVDKWQVGVSGDFGTATNWNALIVPSSSVDVQITAKGTYAVTSTIDETINSLATESGATLAVTAGTFTITNGTGTGASAGTISVGDGATLRLGGTFKNTGAITLNAIFVPSKLVLISDLSLEGSGVVTLSDNASNSIDSNGSPATLTNVANTISGAGSIGDGDATLTLVNNKIINATGANNALVIDTKNAVTNSGKLEATGAAGLLIYDTVQNTTTGSVSAAATGSIVDLAGGNIDGGKVDIVAGAVLKATSGASTLEDLTVTDKGILEAKPGSSIILENTAVNAAGGVVETADPLLIPSEVALDNATITSGTLTNNGGIIDTVVGSNDTLNGVAISAGSAVTVTDDSTLTLKVAVNNAGSIELDSTGDPTTLAISGNVSLQGAGSVSLSDNSDNSILSNGAAAKLTNVDNTISGAASIGGGDNTLTLVNKGTIDATGTNPFVISTGSNAITNVGLMQASAGSSLKIASTLTGSGNLDSEGGKVAVQAAARGGKATIENGGVLELEATSNIDVTFGASAQLSTSGYSFMVLSDPSAGAPTVVDSIPTAPTAINGAGEVVGYYFDDNVNAHGFLYSNGTYTTIDGQGGSNTKLTGINDAGQMVGFYDEVGGPVVPGFLYSNGVFTPLPVGLVPLGINDAGEIVGSDSNPDGSNTHSVLYENGTFTSIQDPEATGQTFVTGINNQGEVVGYYVFGGELDPFSYQNGVYTDLLSSHFSNEIATAVNDAGQVVGPFVNDPGGFVDTNGSLVALPQDPGLNIGPLRPVGINDRGEIIGTPDSGFSNSALLMPLPSTNVLTLGDSADYTGSISGLSPGDEVDLADVNLATLKPLKYTPNKTNTGGTLTVNDGTKVATLHLLGQYAAAGFQASADVGTGTVISYAAPASSAESIIVTAHG